MHISFDDYNSKRVTLRIPTRLYLLLQNLAKVNDYENVRVVASNTPSDDFFWETLMHNSREALMQNYSQDVDTLVFREMSM